MTISRRIREGRARLQMTEQEFADAVGVTRGAVQQWERGTTAPTRKNQPAVARLLGITVGELMNPGSGMAQLMSLSAADDPPLITWGEIMQNKLPERFILQLPDDALAPNTPAGTAVIFANGNEPPEPGVGILVEDRFGARYVRIYRPGVGGGWSAYARNDNFPTLDAEKHGLKILAVARNRMLDGSL